MDRLDDYRQWSTEVLKAWVCDCLYKQVKGKLTPAVASMECGLALKALEERGYFNDTK